MQSVNLHWVICTIYGNIHATMKRLFSLKNAKQERILFGRRVGILLVVIGLLVLLLIGRLAYLQISQHQRYTTLARQNQFNLLPLEPNRGLIYDRYGVVLAENVPMFDLVIIPNRVSNIKETLASLQEIIPITADDIRQFNRQIKLHRQFESVSLRARLTEEEVARFSVEQYRFPGVAIHAVTVRHYPLGAAFAQAVGFVGRINEKELKQVDESNYSATNFVGKTGMEKFYENLLHGTVGYQQQETDATGHVVRVLQSTPPVAGNSLYLTIDSKLQSAIEQVLGNQRGAIVALNPQNGELLAYVSNPSFDPNLFVTGISKNEYETLRKMDGQPLYDRVLRGQFPPGSTVKPFIALEALRSGIITPAYTVFDPGWFQLKDSTHIYHDKVRTGHGSVDLPRAITVSCDTYFYNLANKIGIQHIDTALNNFGFGQATGIDLIGEAIGIIPSPEWKRRKQGTPWYPGDTVITGIGQGFTLVTPLQLADAIATIAARGQRWMPHILLHKKAADGTLIAAQPMQREPIVIDNNTWEVVINAMQGVTKDPGGTAYRFFRDAPYTLAGKTGTAQVFSLKKNQRYNAKLLPENLRDNSLFIAFAPVENPQIALAIIIQNSATPAAAIARQILDAYLIKKS